MRFADKRFAGRIILRAKDTAFSAFLQIILRGSVRNSCAGLRRNHGIFESNGTQYSNSPNILPSIPMNIAVLMGGISAERNVSLPVESCRRSPQSRGHRVIALTPRWVQMA